MGKLVKFKVKDEEDKKDLFAKVSAQIEIQDIRLVDCRCERFPNPEKNGLNVDLSYTVKTRIDKSKNTILVFPRFTLKAVPEAQKGDADAKPVIEIEALFLAVYQAESLDGLTDAHFSQFGLMNGVYNTWPYWREFVQNILARMGLPKLVLPAYRYGEVKTQAEKDPKTKTPVPCEKAEKK